MNKVFMFMEKKYQDEILPWLTYLTIPTSILFLVGYLFENDLGDFLMVLGAIIPFTASVITQISLKYGGKYLMSIASFGGLSFGMIITIFGKILNLGVIETKHYLLLAVILMGIFVIACSRKKFSERDELILAGKSMMVTFFFGAVLGVVLALLLSFLGGIGVLIGFISGMIIAISYYGMKLGEKFNLDENEIYSPLGAGIVGAGIGGLFGVSYNRIFSRFYQPLYIEIISVDFPIGLTIHLIAGATSGLVFGYLAQKMKKNIDRK